MGFKVKPYADWSDGYILEKDYYTKHEICGTTLIFPSWVTDDEMEKYVNEHERECTNEERA